MDDYFNNWLSIKTLFLDDAMRMVAEYATVLEGHEEADDFRVCFRNHFDKIKSFVKKDVCSDGDKFPGSIAWVEITKENWNSRTFDEDGAPIDEIDFQWSKVQPLEFLTWCASKKIKFPPQLLGGESKESDEDSDDKDINNKILAAIHAGVICREQGTEIKKEDLYAKVKKRVKISGPKYESIWKLIPENYKLGAGNPSTIVERAIKGGVIAGISTNRLDRKNLSKSVKDLLTSHDIENIDPDYLDVIVETISAWAPDQTKPSQ